MPFRPFLFRRVTDPAELDAVYRLRYDVFATELGYHHPDDAATARVCEPADRTGHILAAYHPDGDLIATLRFNRLADGVPAGFAAMLAAVGHPLPDLADTTFSSRFVIRPEYRAGTVCSSLMAFGYRTIWGMGVRKDVIVSSPHLVAMYRRLGYTVVRDDLVHPNAGPQSLLELDLTADTLFRRMATRGGLER